MTALNHVPSLLSRTGAASALTLAVVGGTVVAPGLTGEAQAATHGTKALKIAASKKGSPYRYGAVGPNRFDCSGLTLYSFKKTGKKLPRTAAAQYNKTKHISKSQRTRGDLVFFHSGRNVYHVGIYAGNGRIWHAPKRNTVVRLERIWTKSVWYGRVR
ncbi:C40 family peptidase [Streptomyces kanamyceticus]|uniref:NlpC/P60 family protein n=1 Tax=Streptomyces kanamyceticus TaxID=1967 RepID=A0A5J6GTV3_STRKN|nr:C40 family peptidase [Streptomyces kanamyceticus]QEU96476.1 NlpC/P60 family protein [Streptomyces kanamyceticus]